MAKEYYQGEVTKHTDWGGDESTSNLPLSGDQVQSFIKEQLSKKLGVMHELATKYLFFADEEDKAAYLEDNTQTQLILCEIKKSGDEELVTTRVKLERVTDNLTVRKGDRVVLTYTYDHVDKDTQASTGNPAEVTIKIVGGPTLIENVMANSVNNIDVTRYMNTGNNTIQVTARVNSNGTSQESTISWGINVLDIKLDSSFNFATLTTKGDNVNIPCVLTGGAGATLKLYVDGVNIESENRTVSTSRYITTFEVGTYSMSHGTHSIQLVAEIGLASGDVVKSNSIYFDIPVVERDNNTPIIAARFDYDDGTILGSSSRPRIGVAQYESYTLNLAVYDPQHEETELTIWQNGNMVSSLTTPFEPIQLTQKAMALETISGYAGSGSTVYFYQIDVSRSSVDVSEPTGAMNLKLLASGRNNSEANKSNWVYRGITTTFNGMMWSNDTDGWTGRTLKLVGNATATVNFKPLQEPVNATGATATVIKYKVSNVIDENAKVIKCLNSENKGFEITPQEVRFITKSGSVVSSKMASGTEYEVAFVTMPVATRNSSEYERQHDHMAMLFINGINSGCVQLDELDSPYQTNPANIEIAACNASVEISSIRNYSTYLTSDQVLDLYIIDQDTTDQMLEIYKANDILDFEGNISVESVPAGMRVVIITGKQSNGMATVMQAAVTNNKKTKFNVDGILSYIQGDADTSKNFNVLGGCISLQGTSSLAYPVKNYRIYTYDSNETPGVVTVGCDKYGEGGTVKSNGKVSFKETAAPVKCWCLKADAAESSSSHNTGVARLVHNTLMQAGELTPPQKYVDKTQYSYDVRTTIDGEPCMFFYRKTFADTPVFLGKFNFNNDKSTEAVFGFCDIPGYHDQPWFEQGNSTECWEFLNNDYPMGKFKDDDFDTRVSNGKGGTIPNWLNVFEARFPDDKGINAQYENGTKRPYYLESIVKWVRSTDTTAAGLSTAQVAARRNKFTNELKYYFDVDYLCDYYEFTDILAAVDQRVKNMMMAIWYNPDAEEHEVMGKMRAYMIFYDNDTILGVRNDGRNKYNWDIDENSIDTELSTEIQTVYAFAGHDSVLWKNLRDCFQDKLKAAYTRIREKMSNEDIFAILDSEQCDMWPEAVFNADAVNKYIAPKTIGVEVIEDGAVIRKTYDYMEQLQGSRKAHRHWFVSNRMQLLDAWAGAGNYTGTDISWKGYSSAGASVSATMARQYYVQFRRESDILSSSKLEIDQPYNYQYQEDANIGTIFHLLGGRWMKTLDLSGWGGFTDLSLPNLPVLEYLKLGDRNSMNNSNLASLVIDDKLPQLKTLIVQGWSGLTNLNLAQCSRLETLDLTGCVSLANLTLAQGAPVKTLLLPQGLTTLKLEHLSNLHLWNGIEGLNTDTFLPSVRDIIITNCDELLSDISWLNTWLDSKTTEDSLCSLNLTGVHWTNIPIDFLYRLANLETKRLAGTIALAETPTPEQVSGLIQIFGEDAFSDEGPLRITAPGEFVIVGSTEITEGGSEVNPFVVKVVSLIPGLTDVSLRAETENAGVNVQANPRTMSVSIWSTVSQGVNPSSRSVRITVQGRTTENTLIRTAIVVQIRPFTYPSSFDLSQFPSYMRIGDSLSVRINPSIQDYTGDVYLNLSVGGGASGAISITQGNIYRPFDCIIGVTGFAESLEARDFTVHVEAWARNASDPFWVGTKQMSIVTGQIIMTSESNPDFMRVCYEAGWTASPNVMTKEEAEAVTDGTPISNNYFGQGLEELRFFKNITNWENTFNKSGSQNSTTVVGTIIAPKISDLPAGVTFGLTYVKADALVIDVSGMAGGKITIPLIGGGSRYDTEHEVFISHVYLYGFYNMRSLFIGGSNGNYLVDNALNSSNYTWHIPSTAVPATDFNSLENAFTGIGRGYKEVVRTITSIDQDFPIKIFD